MGKDRDESKNRSMKRCIIFPCFRGRVSSSSSSSASCSIDDDEGGGIVRYSYKTLSTAARGFHSACKIGEGGFGSVYKGILENGTVVAIKLLSPKSVQGEREFLAEIDSMTRARHQNLVRLRGYCIEGTKRVLVYEYMERRSLSQIFLNARHSDNNFTWGVRKRISMGIARGLAYLHEEIKPHIIHRDIKPSNILLDSNLTAKISDFGLAKLFPDNMTHVSTRVAGTIGYLAPEYARSGKLTRKSDVYSFGVLMLEIISGQSSSNYAFGFGDFNIVEKAWELYKDGKLLQLVDPSISSECIEQEYEIEQFLKVALLCVQEIPNLRPPMSNVVKLLSAKTETSSIQISQPGVISDLHILKLSQTPDSNNTPSRLPSNQTSYSSQSTVKYFSESPTQFSK